jgi:hypothetical protein
LEATARGPSVEEYIAEERRRSHEYGGRSIFGWEPAPATAADDALHAPASRRTG